MGEVRSPRFRRFPFMRNGVSDHGRAVTPCIAVHNILPSTFSTASASARLNFSRLNIPLHMIAELAAAALALSEGHPKLLKDSADPTHFESVLPLIAEENRTEGAHRGEPAGERGAGRRPLPTDRFQAE